GLYAFHRDLRFSHSRPESYATYPSSSLDGSGYRTDHYKRLESCTRRCSNDYGIRAFFKEDIWITILLVPNWSVCSSKWTVNKYRINTRTISVTSMIGIKSHMQSTGHCFLTISPNG